VNPQVAVGQHVKYVSLDSWLAWLYNRVLWPYFSLALIPCAPVDKSVVPSRACLAEYFQLENVRREGQVMTAQLAFKKEHTNFFRSMHGERGVLPVVIPIGVFMVVSRMSLGCMW
jgi:hypothetical protein